MGIVCSPLATLTSAVRYGSALESWSKCHYSRTFSEKRNFCVRILGNMSVAGTTYTTATAGQFLELELSIELVVVVVVVQNLAMKTLAPGDVDAL
jgi:hypothetical protein